MPRSLESKLSLSSTIFLQMRWHDRPKIIDLLRYMPYMAQNKNEDLEEKKY
jgi:hypothetical protein